MRKILRGILKGIYFIVPDKTKDKIMNYLHPKTTQITSPVFWGL